jgi:hypothetical protein
VRLHGVATSKGESELSDVFQGDPSQPFTEGIHRLRGGRELGKTGLRELTDVRRQVEARPNRQQLSLIDQRVQDHDRGCLDDHRADGDSVAAGFQNRPSRTDVFIALR